MKEQNVTVMTEPNSGNTAGFRKNGGLYRNVKVSVKTLNIVILAAIAALFISMFFLISHNGFTVTFDTDGGSYVESCKAMYGEQVTAPGDPVKEGWSFTGWYLDRDCTVEWNMQTDTVSESMTLYAGWIPAENGS